MAFAHEVMMSDEHVSLQSEASNDIFQIRLQSLNTRSGVLLQRPKVHTWVSSPAATPLPQVTAF
jgi:hypothetical protein